MPANFRVMDVTANLAFYEGDRKVLETQAIRANRMNQSRPDVVPLNLQIPVSQLKPGRYTCQVNVIDELGRKFAFPRTALVVLPATKPNSTPGTTAPVVGASSGL